MEAGCIQQLFRGWAGPATGSRGGGGGEALMGRAPGDSSVCPETCAREGNRVSTSPGTGTGQALGTGVSKAASCVL